MDLTAKSLKLQYKFYHFHEELNRKSESVLKKINSWHKKEVATHLNIKENINAAFLHWKNVVSESFGSASVHEDEQVSRCVWVQITFHVIVVMGKVHQQLLCCDKQPELQRFIIKNTKHFKGFTASYAFYIPHGQSCNTMLPLFGNVFTSTDLRPLNQERLPHVRHDP